MLIINGKKGEFENYNLLREVGGWLFKISEILDPDLNPSSTTIF
jgi:hypothetical protein